MKDGQESWFSSGNCQGGRETSGKRTAVWLIVLDCESLVEYVQPGHSVTRTWWGQATWRKEKDFLCVVLTQKQELGTPCCLCSHCISSSCAFVYGESRGRGFLATVTYQIRLPAYSNPLSSLLCSLLCVHLQFRSLLRQMILTGFGFMRHVWIELHIACSLWSMQNLYQETSGWVSNATLRSEGWYHIFQYKRQGYLIVRCYKMIGMLKTDVSSRGLTRVNSKIAESSGYYIF